MITHLKLQNTDNIKNNIDEILKTKKEVDLGGDHYSTSKESRQFMLFEHRHDELLVPVIDFIKNLVEQNRGVNLKLSGAWTVLGQENGYHTVHRHNMTSLEELCTVLYLESPLNTPEQDTDGKGAFYYFDYENSHLMCKHFLPTKGDLLIFPAYMLHGSYPQAKGLRQTLNLDFSIHGLK